MNDLWIVGVAGGGAGAALGIPMLVNLRWPVRERLSAEALIGAWVGMAGVAMLLIGLRHGNVLAGATSRIAEHVEYVMNLCGWVVIVLASRRAVPDVAAPLTNSPWWQAVQLAPILAYPALVVANGGGPVRFIWILPFSLLGAAGVVMNWWSARGDARTSAETKSFLGGLALFVVMLAAAQAFRTFAPWVRPLREIVPFVATAGFLWFGVRVRSRIVMAPEGPVHAPPEESPGPAYARSNLTADRAGELLLRLSALMDAGAHRESNATLQSVARALGVSAHTLSQALNQHGGRTFNEYMTSRRVKDAKRALLDPANDCYTIEAIASEAGFTSRSAFYRAFRETEGVAPAVLRQR